MALTARLWRYFWLFIATLVLAVVAAAAESDFYETLGISRDANSRDIRRAFKQAALKYHPDKNDEPDAHAKFLRINRAYEVLKDDDLRRKYDLHGEAGLDENAGGGGQYQSWNYYQQDFGLYDEDPEIVTLSASDFDLLVVSSNDTWFVNFYSPGCPPCHKLAPTWREVARDIDGIVRVGAVNCQEDHGLCVEQGIRAYPSLVLYPNKQGRYQGDRTRDALVSYVMQHVTVSFHRPATCEFFQSASLPWLVHFCSPNDDDNCLSERAMLRLSGMLNDLMSVGFVDCELHPSLCKEHQAVSGETKYYPRQRSTGKEETSPTNLPLSLDARELCTNAVSLLPTARVFTEKSFNAVRSRIHAEPVLVLFGVGKAMSEDVEVRKLSSLLSDMEVGVVDCSSLPSICAEYYVTGNEGTMLLKPKGYELFYGKRQALDIAAFARESALSSVRALSPADFPAPVTQGDPFFVDFFAPWCPPCRRLLPQFRKAAAGMASVQFGTVDCVVHKELCRSYNVHSYPTTILYNSSTPHQYSGSHSAGEMVEFAQDVLVPSVIDLTPQMFELFVGKRKEGTSVLVDFYSPHCGPCIELAPTWNKLAKSLKDKMLVAKVDCAKYNPFCRQQNVQGYPTMRAYPGGQKGTGSFQNYQGWRNLPSLRSWALSFLPRVSEYLSDLTFDKQVVQRHDRPYLVLFTAGHWCGPCQAFNPEFEDVARRLLSERYIMGFGVLDCDQYRFKCGEAQIRQYPLMKVYEGDGRFAASGMMIHSQNVDEIVQVIKQNVPTLRKKPKKGKKTGNKHDEL